MLSISAAAWRIGEKRKPCCLSYNYLDLSHMEKKQLHGNDGVLWRVKESQVLGKVGKHELFTLK